MLGVPFAIALLSSCAPIRKGATRTKWICALGCVLHELVEGSRAFEDDFCVREHAKSQNPIPPQFHHVNLPVDLRCKRILSQLQENMLRIPFYERPTTGDILALLAAIDHQDTAVRFICQHWTNPATSPQMTETFRAPRIGLSQVPISYLLIYWHISPCSKPEFCSSSCTVLSGSESYGGRIGSFMIFSPG